MGWGPWAGESTWSPFLGAQHPFLEFLRRVTVSAEPLWGASLPDSLVCNVFMYVFVNVTETLGSGRVAGAAPH